MSDLNDALLELRRLALRQPPEAEDTADRRFRETLAQEFAGRHPKSPAWTKRTVRIGPFSFAPAVLLAVFAATAVAAGAVIGTSATTIFQHNPQQQARDKAGVFPDPQTVITASVLEVTSTTIPDYGTVEFWTATTKQRGFCFALKLPDGIWGGLDHAHPGPHGWRGGWMGGTVPGCLPTHHGPLNEWGSQIQNKAGQQYTIYVGYVDVQGKAATIRDSKTGVTAPVNSDGYFLLAEPALWLPAPPHAPSWMPKRIHCAGCGANLQVLNAAGQPLGPTTYTAGRPATPPDQRNN
jgi:hypothetical protein